MPAGDVLLKASHAQGDRVKIGRNSFILFEFVHYVKCSMCELFFQYKSFPGFFTEIAHNAAQACYCRPQYGSVGKMRADSHRTGVKGTVGTRENSMVKPVPSSTCLG